MFLDIYELGIENKTTRFGKTFNNMWSPIYDKWRNVSKKWL